MSKFFIHRPIFAIVIAITILILGSLAIFSLPIAQYPKITQPTVSVSTSYSGANASIINQSVAQVIEQQVNGTQGMDYMSSNSSNNGTYNLRVRFNLDTNSDMDAVLVQNSVSIATASLPTDVKNVGVTTRKSSGDMAYLFAMYSPNKTFNRTFISNYANVYIVDALKRIKGVGDVTAFTMDYSMRIWINPERLSELGLTISDIRSAISEQNAQAPAGTIGLLPVPENQEKQYTGKLEGRISTVEDFENVILKTNSDGANIYLRDVARIETGARSANILTDTNDAPSAGFGINLTDDANAIETIGEVKRVIEEMSHNFPDDLEYCAIIDNTEYINESLLEVLNTFKEALMLVIIIVFIFLQSFRATLIPVLAIPVSLIGTFATFTILGFTINTLTLFAMVLAIGLVVDDAIVVIENVEHHMKNEGLGAIEATEVAMAEVQGPVVAIAFVLSAVFVPVAFLGGMTGVLYRQFALTIAVSMGLSAFIALTLTPALCALLMKPHNPNAKKNFLDKAFDRFNNWFDRTQKKYTGVVGWFIRHAKIGVVSMLIICALTAAVYKMLPSTFVPNEDQGYLLTAVNLPSGTSLNRTYNTMVEMSKEIEKIPGVLNVMNIAGYDALSGGNKSSSGAIFVGLNPWGERTTKDLAITNITREINKLGAKYTEASVAAFTTPALPGLGMVGGWSMELLDMTGYSDEELDAIAKRIVAAANQRPELQRVRTTYTIDSPICNFEINREKAKQLGVAFSDVYMALQANFGGTQIGDFMQFGRNYKIMLQADAQYRSETEALKFIYVRSRQGTMVPLDSLLTAKFLTSPAIITRFNGTRSISFQGSTPSGYSSGQSMDAMEEVVHEVVPTGFGIEWSGQSREEKASSGSTMQVMGLALVFVFLCLAALYESWSVPFAVLLTVPTGIFGAFFVQWALFMIFAMLGSPNPGLMNSIYMQIGVIMIIGLAAKNAILIVEFAKVRTDKGMDAMQAAVEAAGLRLRPILMTSLAFIIGCLPLAMASGAGSAARNGMGTAVVGGMLFATSIGIFLIPVFFFVVERISSKFSGKSKVAAPQIAKEGAN